MIQMIMCIMFIFCFCLPRIYNCILQISQAEQLEGFQKVGFGLVCFFLTLHISDQNFKNSIRRWQKTFSIKGRTSNTTLRILSVSGVPPPPCSKKPDFSPKKKGYGFGGYPRPPVYGFFLAKRGVRIWGVSPLSRQNENVSKF